MKILDIPPKYLNNDLVKLICSNKKLKKKYIRKYKDFFENQKYILQFGKGTLDVMTDEVQNDIQKYLFQ